MEAEVMKNEAMEQSGGITLSNIKNLFAIQGKDAGGSLALRGKVVLVAFLINDGESKWNKNTEKEFQKVLESICTNLMNASGFNKQQLQITYAYRQVSIPYKMDCSDSKRCIKDVLRQFNCKTIQEYQQHYKEKFKRDEVPISFVFNKDFRSFAQRIEKQNCVSEKDGVRGEEYSIVSFQMGEERNCERTFIHELMHQFGAIDLYYPEFLKVKADRLLPDSIMNGGMLIDHLTRYVIGWDEELSKEALAFLKEIENLTEEDIECANKDEWKKKWR